MKHFEHFMPSGKSDNSACENSLKLELLATPTSNTDGSG